MSLRIIIGPMMAGKSTELLRRLRRYIIADKKCLLINYIDDNRYKNNIITHDGTSVNDNNYLKLKYIKTKNLFDINNNIINDYDVIGIDEAQFYPDLYNFCRFNLNNNKIIITAGLNGDFNQNKFGQILDLIPIADKVNKLTAICNCGYKASFTKKIIIETTNQIDIGSSDKYMAVCRNCLNN